MGGAYLQVSRLAESPGTKSVELLKRLRGTTNALNLGHGTLYPGVIKAGGIALYIRC
jgi:hypothetical protein